MNSFLLLGAPRSGTTHVGKLLAKLFACKYYLSEPLRSICTSQEYIRTFNELLCGEFTWERGVRSGLASLLSSELKVGLKETLRFHVQNDPPTRYWVNYISSKPPGYFANVFVLLRNPCDTIESIINRFGPKAIDIDFERQDVRNNYYRSWVHNFNSILSFSKKARLQIILYESFVTHRYDFCNPSLARFSMSAEPILQKFMPLKIAGIGDARALRGGRRVKPKSNQKFLLSKKERLYIANRLDIGLSRLYP